MAPKSRKRNAQDAPSASHVPDDTTGPTYDAIRFRSLAHQQHFFEWVQNRTPNMEIPFQLHATEFPHITAEVERRGWRYLCNPIQGRLEITLLREFYSNAKKTKRERALNPPMYILHIRGKELDYSPEGPSYEARKSSNDLRLGDVLRDIARGWLDFLRRSLMPTSNANEVTVERVVLIHSIMEGLSIKAELLISKHISAAAKSKDPNKRLSFTGVIYRLLYANGFKKKCTTKFMKKEIYKSNIFNRPQQFDLPQPPPQNFPQEYNWQKFTQQFQGMRVEQNNQFKDFFDQQNSFFEEMHTQTKAYKQGFEDLRVQQHKYVDEIKASQEITHKAVLELRENQDKHGKELATHRRKYKKDYKEMKADMEKQKAQFEAANQYWHQLNSKNEQKIDYLCWGVQQVNPYLKGRLPEDIPEWMQGNV
ncbi:hypothetical protein PIB30_038332 [Stylosanthes scabra]|uniref:Putative plant transposon protein domain-containing protein n=1 Tax=Stylosanthes scabra TaxID=79078 RepID=A0ABU6WE41_9FABA|nr:hypothetical protein [Stylosanthes scabra]